MKMEYNFSDRLEALNKKLTIEQTSQLHQDIRRCINQHPTSQIELDNLFLRYEGGTALKYVFEANNNESRYICLWYIAIKHVEAPNSVKGLEKCLNCDGHDLLCPDYINQTKRGKHG